MAPDGMFLHVCTQVLCAVLFNLIVCVLAFLYIPKSFVNVCGGKSKVNHINESKQSKIMHAK